MLLVNELPGVAHMAMPSKLTSYFQAGKPVLAATDEGGFTAKEIALSGAGDPGARRPSGPVCSLRRCAWGPTANSRSDSAAAGRRYSDKVLSATATHRQV